MSSKDGHKRPYDWPQTPGPGAYSVNCNQKGGGFMGDGPSFSVSGRKGMPRPNPASPGPVYSPRAAGNTGDAPAYTFGTSRKEHIGGKSPGPSNYTPAQNSRGTSSLGDGAGAAYGFGTSPQREATHSPRGNRYISKKHAITSNFGMNSPGPALYLMQGGFNTNLADSARANSPRYSIRPKLPGYNTEGAPPGSGKLPGPGSYNHAGSGAFGPQTRSVHKSSGCYSFGFSERPGGNHKKATYMGKDFDKANLGIHSPAPNLYSQKSSIGSADASTGSRYKNMPAFSFGTEDRFAY